ncbi:MAG: ATPase [Bacteroidetes bacterium]|nr:MAG: ATPase [Bacteroidota bacterium]
MIRKIAITGPESTGKSQLAEQLARHYHTHWVAEFAREYLNLLERPYEENDILVIAKGQMQREAEAEAEVKRGAEATAGIRSGEIQATGQDQYLFCDTELLVTKIWSEVKYGRCHPWILQQLDLHSYDLYLLCYIDTPWEADPQREHPHMREQLFNLYYDEMLERGWNFRVVTGLGEERLQNAIKFIDTCFSG